MATMRRITAAVLLLIALCAGACGERYTSGPEESARLGYVNPGTDRRYGGEIGELAGRAQSDLSFKDATPPTKQLEQRPSGALVELATAPNGKPHISIAIPRGNGRWATARFGWRFDPNWGDARTIGHNPDPGVIGGYIFDAVLKLDADKSFIE